MNTHRFVPIATLFAALALSADIQPFDTGSDGSMGDFVVNGGQNTFDLPPDGRLKVRSLYVGPNNTLYLRPNAANTPVYILSQGNILIEGAISVVGQGTADSAISGGLGGPGGFRGGNRSTDATSNANGQGPGGGKHQFNNIRDYELAGAGGHRFMIQSGRGDQNGVAYGTPVLIPLIGGSGGGGAWNHAGGGGGGAILLASATSITVTGTITARGGSAPDYNGGSGGAIRLVAPVLAGGGTLDVRGDSSGSIGRIRLDSVDARTPGYNTPDTVPSTGSLLITGLDLPGAPRLELVQIGRTVINGGEQNAVSLILPAGSTPQQAVVVRASNFGRRVPIQVVLTPDSGPRQIFAAEIDNSDAGSTQVSVPVTFPVNVTTVVNVWTAP